MRTRLVVADDHPIVLDGLVQLFAAEKDFDVVVRCSSGDEALMALRRVRPDVAVLDIRMPGVTGIELLRHVHVRGELKPINGDLSITFAGRE